MEFKQKVIELIDTNIIKSELVRATGKSLVTIQRWIRNRDPQLTRKDCLLVITKETGIAEDELFATEKELESHG